MPLFHAHCDMHTHMHTAKCIYTCTLQHAHTQNIKKYCLENRESFSLNAYHLSHYHEAEEFQVI